VVVDFVIQEQELGLGPKIRAIRTKRGLLIREVAAKAGVTVGLISQIERGRVNPSVGTLKKLADALDVPITSFFDSTGPRVGPVIREHERKRLPQASKGVRYSLLTPDINCTLEVIYSEYEPGASSGEFMFVHRGEEVGYVLSGVMKVTVGTESYVLHEGDTIHFNCMLPHRVENIGSTVLKTLWAITPPSF